jgi:GNAT superfamily N-acetyltransferase
MTGFRLPRVESLDIHHDRSIFCCGEEALDQYIRSHAGQDIRRNLTSVFVAVDDPGGQIIGYYTLSAASFNRDDLPEELARKLPRYPIPAALIGRLAVDRRFHGQQYGKFLLLNAFERVMRASDAIAIHAMVVEAKDDKAAAFYAKYGFITFSGQPRRLFLPLARLKARC